jgi:limonene-1,2-epoxide hydrolase
MVKIHIQADCGNAPKKLFVKDFIVALVNNDQAFINRNSTDDIQWNVVGGQHIEGKEAVLAQLGQLRSDAVVELAIHTIVTHGYDGVAEGLLKFKDGRTMAFCDVYRFRASTNNAPIKSITTYTVALAAQ